MTGDPVQVAEPETASIGDLLRRLIEDVGLLFRTELRLARTEIHDNLSAAKGGAAAIAIGGIFLTGSLLAFLGAAVGFLEPYVGAGWAALIVGGVSLVLGGILVAVGASTIGKAKIAPKETVVRLKKDVEALKGEN